MPRGKPFICWIDEGNRTALHIGDEVELQLESGDWVRGKFGYRKKNGIFPYVVKCGKVEHQAALRHKLRGIE